jgi:hypothetical protein
MALSLTLGLLAAACGKHGASLTEDAGNATDTNTDTDTPVETGTGTIADTATDTSADTESVEDSESAEGDGTETDIAADAGASTDSARDSESAEGNTDSVEDGSTDTQADTETADDGAGVRLTGYSITSGAVVGHSSHFNIAVFLGGGPLVSGRSTNYRIFADIGGRVTP